jgi:hypothetical protein
VDLRGRVVHSCSHENAAAFQGALPDRGFAAPAPMAVAARSARRKLPVLIAIFATFVAGVFFVSRPAKVFTPPSPSVAPALSTVCGFTSGRNAGRTLDLSPAEPLPIGHACQDSAGNEGTIVERPPSVAVAVQQSKSTLRAWLGAVAVAGLLSCLFAILQKRRHREAGELAAAASAYFRALGA